MQFSQNLTNFDKEFTRRKRLNTENMKNDFRDYAVKHLGMNPLALDKYASTITSSYISPTIIEERQLNVASDGRVLTSDDGSHYISRH